MYRQLALYVGFFTIAGTEELGMSLENIIKYTNLITQRDHDANGFEK
jgi:hypothetical protein